MRVRHIIVEKKPNPYGYNTKSYITKCKREIFDDISDFKMIPLCKQCQTGRMKSE